MTVRLAAFDRIGGASALFRAYLSADPRLAPFAAHGGLPTDAAIRAAAAARPPDDATGASGVFARRADIADALRAQQPRWHDGPVGPSVAAALDRLARPDSLAVVTGQQVSLLGGPLYTPLKALSAVLLARRAEALTGRPTVPVFWMATEDHDADEVDHARIGTTDLRHRLPVPRGMRNHGAAGRLVLGGDIAPVVEAAVAALPETPHAAAVAALLRRAYTPGTTLADAFGRLVAGLFDGHGLVILDADDPALKRLAAPMLERAIRSGPALAASVRDAGQRLVSMGFHAQLPDPTAPGLFHLDDRGRLALDIDAGGETEAISDRSVSAATSARAPQTDPSAATGFTIRGTVDRFTLDALADVARTAPERLSPAAWLRPAMQDALLPTVAYVGGPGEIAYWLQLRGVYDGLGVPMPLVAPRISATLVDDRTRRALVRTGAAGGPDAVEDVPSDADALFARLADHAPEIARAFDAADAAIAAAFDALAAPLASLGDSGRAGGGTDALARSRDAARTRALAASARLRATARRAERRRQSDLRRDTARVVAMLRPNGALQERAVSALPFAAIYGPRFVADLAAALDDALPGVANQHAVVTL